MKRLENTLKYLSVMHMTIKCFPNYNTSIICLLNAMKNRDISTYDLWKSPNKVVSDLCFPTNVFLYDIISYPNFSIIVVWITFIDKVNF